MEAFHLRKVWERNYIVTNSFLTQICYLALQKLLNLTVCFPSVKLNITCYFFLFPQSHVKFKICNAISRWKEFINTKYLGWFSTLPWEVSPESGREKSRRGMCVWPCRLEAHSAPALGMAQRTGRAVCWPTTAQSLSPRTLNQGWGVLDITMYVSGHLGVGCSWTHFGPL